MSHTEEPFNFPQQINQRMLYNNSLSSVTFLFHSGNVTKAICKPCNNFRVLCDGVVLKVLFV